MVTSPPGALPSHPPLPTLQDVLKELGPLKLQADAAVAALLNTTPAKWRSKVQGKKDLTGEEYNTLHLLLGDASSQAYILPDKVDRRLAGMTDPSGRPLFALRGEAERVGRAWAESLHALDDAIEHTPGDPATLEVWRTRYRHMVSSGMQEMRSQFAASLRTYLRQRPGFSLKRVAGAIMDFIDRINPLLLLLSSIAIIVGLVLTLILG